MTIHAPSRRIWITRAQPGADATAARLREMGFEPVVASLLEIRPIPGAVIDLAGVDALAFTSAAGLAAFGAVTTVRDLPVFAVGDATTEAATAAGFADARSAGGDVHVLAALIAAATPRPVLVLNPTAAAPAADLVQLLADRGVGARSVAVYETCETALTTAPADLDSVLVHSAKAAGILAHRLTGIDAPRLDVCAISPAAAAPLAGLGFRSLLVADRPDEVALLALLRRAGA